MPPSGGFISKWYLVLGSVDAREMVFLAVLLVSSVLNAAYFLPVTYTAFFDKEKPPPAGDGAEAVAHDDIREIPLVVIPLVITAILSLVMGVYPGYFLTLAAGVVP